MTKLTESANKDIAMNTGQGYALHAFFLEKCYIISRIFQVNAREKHI
ncbi:MAG: hypothetical protein Q8K59_12455 [Nitrosomonas sp.]|nr:hypothetical protein [Nitrosomonas sp.]MDP1951877.1 hypothetical protein [Nitrosomonas sp.]